MFLMLIICCTIVIALATVFSICLKQGRLVMFPMHLTDSENLVKFFTYAKYNKQQNRNNFVRIPLMRDTKESISNLPFIINLTQLNDVSKHRINFNNALTKPSPYQWRDMKEFSQKLLLPLTITSSRLQIVICLSIESLPHFEFFRVAILKCYEYFTEKITIIVYHTRTIDVKTEQSVANALVDYLHEFKCIVRTGTTKENFNLIREAKHLIVLSDDAFGLMAAISGDNFRVIKNATPTEENLAWPENFLLLRNFPLIDRCGNLERYLENLKCSLQKPKKITFFEEMVRKMNVEILDKQLKRFSSS
jgi:hypothetical protein